MTTRLIFPVEADIRHPLDADRIVSVMAEAGYAISPEDATLAWEAHSERFCAGWLILPQDDDEIVSEILRETREIPNAA